MFRSPRAWMADRNGWTFTGVLSSQSALTRRCNVTAGRFLPQTLAWRYINNNSTKNSYFLCSDLPGPGRLAGMGGHSLAVYFSHGHGQGAAILQRARHWLGATIIIITLKILLFVFRSPRAWMAGRNGPTDTADTSSWWTFTGGLFFQWALQRASYCRRHWLGATTIIIAIQSPAVCV